MNELDLRAALIQGYLTAVLPAVLPTEYENTKFTVPDGCALWTSVKQLPTGDDPVTLGSGGENEVTGIFQIDVNVPLDTGEKQLQETLDILRSFFTPGKVLTYNGVTVTVKRFNKSPARQIAGWHRRSASVYYYNRTPRS